MAGRRSSDRAGRWPWGVWFALVGVSAGTVASFAMVGWAFVSVSGQGAATGAAGAPGWAEESVVLEATPEPGSVPAPEPSADPPRVAEPEAEQVPDPVPEPSPEAGAEHTEESGEVADGPRLVPLPPREAYEEDRRECGGSESPSLPEPTPSDTYSTTLPGLELEDYSSSRPKG